MVDGRGRTATCNVRHWWWGLFPLAGCARSQRRAGYLSRYTGVARGLIEVGLSMRTFRGRAEAKARTVFDYTLRRSNLHPDTECRSRLTQSSRFGVNEKAI